MAVNVVSFSFSWCSTGGPEAHSTGWRLSLLHLVSIFSRHQLIRGPEPLRPGVAFFITTRLTPSPTVTGSVLTSVLTELYNSPRPLDRLLDLWNGMIDCHPAEITVMQFTGHSFPVHQSMSVSWALPCPISSAKSTHAISFDYWPLECVTYGASLCNGMFARAEGQNTTCTSLGIHSTITRVFSILHIHIYACICVYVCVYACMNICMCSRSTQSKWYNVNIYVWRIIIWFGLVLWHINHCRLSKAKIYFIHIIIIIIIMSCRLHGYSWLSLAIPPCHSSPLAGLRGNIPYPHVAAECMFELVVLLLLGHMWGSIGVHHLWTRPCFSSSVMHVWFV